MIIILPSNNYCDRHTYSNYDPVLTQSTAYNSNCTYSQTTTQWSILFKDHFFHSLHYVYVMEALTHATHQLSLNQAICPSTLTYILPHYSPPGTNIVAILVQVQPYLCPQGIVVLRPVVD